MSLTFTVTVQWLKPEVGGRQHDPVVGLRPTIRFQRAVGDWLSGGRDVEIINLDFDESTGSSTVELRLANPAFEGEEKTRRHLVEDELVELLDSYRVIGVGRITSINAG